MDNFYNENFGVHLSLWRKVLTSDFSLGKDEVVVWNRQ